VADQLLINKFIRQRLMRNPQITVEELNEQFSNSGGSGQINGPLVSAARYTLKKKYGVKNLEELLRRTNGDPNISQLIRLLKKRHGNMSEAQCRYWLTQDGIQFSTSLFKRLMSEDDTNTVPPVESPDPKQASGPRARKVTNKGRPVGSKNKGSFELKGGQEGKGPVLH
jgi:hypothetical protein